MRRLYCPFSVILHILILFSTFTHFLQHQKLHCTHHIGWRNSCKRWRGAYNEQVRHQKILLWCTRNGYGERCTGKVKKKSKDKSMMRCTDMAITIKRNSDRLIASAASNSRCHFYSWPLFKLFTTSPHSHVTVLCESHTHRERDRSIDVNLLKSLSKRQSTYLSLPYCDSYSNIRMMWQTIE